MNNFSEPQNHWNLNTLYPIYLKKISAHRFEDLIYKNKLEEDFFFRKFFLKDLYLFLQLQNHWFGSRFFPQKIILNVFSSVII